MVILRVAPYKTPDLCPGTLHGKCRYAQGQGISRAGGLLGLQGRSLLLHNLNGDCIRQATSQVQADTKFVEARDPSAILQDSGN